MELNFNQELARIYQDPLFLVFLDLRKAYDTMDQERLLLALEVYGAGPCLCGLLETFWDLQQVETRHNGFRVPAFPIKRSTTQGGLVSLTLFNVLVDNFIRTWLDMVEEYQRLSHERLGDIVGRCLVVFYANYGMVILRDA